MKTNLRRDELSPLSSVRSLLCDQHHFVPKHHSSLLKWRSLVYQNDLRGKNWVRTFSRVRKDVDARDDRILLTYAHHGDPGIIHGWKSRARKRSETKRLRSQKRSKLLTPQTTSTSDSCDPSPGGERFQFSQLTGKYRPYNTISNSSIHHY